LIIYQGKRNTEKSVQRYDSVAAKTSWRSFLQIWEIAGHWFRVFLDLHERKGLEDIRIGWLGEIENVEIEGSVDWNVKEKVIRSCY